MQKCNSVSHRLGRIALKLKKSKNKNNKKDKQHKNHGLEPRFKYPNLCTIMNLSATSESV